MLTRSLLRTKIAHILYANFQTNSGFSAFDNELNFSVKKAYDLYHLLLLLPQEIAFMAQKEVDAHEVKLLKTDESINPIYNLANQKFPQYLLENEYLKGYIRENSISWSSLSNEITSIYKKLKTATFFEKYINEETLSFEEEKRFWRKFFRSKEIFNDDFDDFLEDQSIYWIDDLSVTLNFIDKTIVRFNEENISNSELLPMYKDDDEKEFVTKLAHTAYLMSEEYNQIIANIVPKWDISRITKIDIILLKMAIAEFKEFPLIPINVTMNEYIEISKFYSTEKSKIFINGVLDKIAKKMVEDSTIIKVK